MDTRNRNRHLVVGLSARTVLKHETADTCSADDPRDPVAVGDEKTHGG